METSYPLSPADSETQIIDSFPQTPPSPTSKQWSTLEPVLLPIGQSTPTAELPLPTLVPAPEVAPTTSDSKRPRGDKEEKRSRTRSRSRSRHRRRSPYQSISVSTTQTAQAGLNPIS